MILIQKDIELSKTQFRTVLNGVLHQDKDLKTDNHSDMKIVTELSPNDREFSDLKFAPRCVNIQNLILLYLKNKQL